MTSSIKYVAGLLETGTYPWGPRDSASEPGQGQRFAHSSGSEIKLALRAAPLKIPMGIRSLAQGVGCPFARTQPALLDPADHGGCPSTEFGWVRDVAEDRASGHAGARVDQLQWIDGGGPEAEPNETTVPPLASPFRVFANVRAPTPSNAKSTPRPSVSDHSSSRNA
jgi:hypothetical protein